MKTKVPELYRLLCAYCTTTQGNVYAICLRGLVCKRINAYTLVFTSANTPYSHTSFGFRDRVIKEIYIFYSAVR